MELETIIGLEVHVQQKTNSKMFSPSNNESEDLAPNTAIHPIDLGHPGTLPVANKKAIKWAIKASLALNCEIPEYSKFDRKHYFYPDLPKAFQISQFDKPIGKNGFVKIIDNQTKDVVKIHINRLHLEEDAAKNTHASNKTLVDYNRAGTPLMEIVSEPDIKSPEHAKAYMQEIRLIMRYIGVSDADMEKGHLRCDANISLRPKGDKNLYAKTEIKNINSFNNVQKAIEYEIERQTELWKAGTPPNVETTRGFNADKGITEEQRSKEGAQDYRYFPEPDLPPMHFVNEMPDICDENSEDIYIPCIKAELPELPFEKRQRFIGEYGLNIDDVNTLVANKEIAFFTDNVISEIQNWANDIKEVEWSKDQNKLVQLSVNWLINRLAKILDDSHQYLHESSLTAENFAELILLLYTNQLNSNNGQKVLEIMVKKGGDASQIMLDHDLVQMSNTNELETVIVVVLLENEKSVLDYKNGKENAIKSLIGQTMAKTKGKANPQLVEKIIKNKLS